MLELKGVSRRFGGLQALFDVNMTVPAGLVVGLIGPNGAGKTTMINNISGLDHPTEGTIHYKGHAIEKAAPHQITRLGIEYSIDDFGVGYSNLSYVSAFPVDCIKIDRSFISQLPASGPVIGLILALARQIGARTVAEGVETLDQAEWLAAQTCDEAQGFLFHRPMPLDDLKRLLAATAPEDRRAIP